MSPGCGRAQNSLLPPIALTQPWLDFKEGRLGEELENDFSFGPLVMGIRANAEPGALQATREPPRVFLGEEGVLMLEDVSEARLE